MSFFKYILTALLSFSVVALFAQVERQADNSSVYGYDYTFSIGATASSFSGSAPDYTGGILTAGTSLLGLTPYSDLDSLQVGDIFFAANNGIYEIDSILSNSGSVASVNLRLLNDPLLLGVGLIPSGEGVVARPSSNGLVPVYVVDGGAGGGLGFKIAALMDNYNKSTIDGQFGNGLPTVNGSEISLSDNLVIGDSLHSVSDFLSDFDGFVEAIYSGQGSNFPVGTAVFFNGTEIGLASNTDTTQAQAIVFEQTVDTLILCTNCAFETDSVWNQGDYVYVTSNGVIDTVSSGSQVGYVMLDKRVWFGGNSGGSQDINSSIDSTTYSNDSAFVWAEGSDYFTGLINNKDFITTQPGHSFDLAVHPWADYGFIPVYLNASGNYALAQSDSLVSMATGYITRINGDDLTLQHGGYVDSPTDGLIEGQRYWLSSSQAGYLTTVEPDTSQLICYVEKGSDYIKLIDQRLVDYSSNPSVYEINFVSDTIAITPVANDKFVNVTKDTLGLYTGLKWSLFFGGSTPQVQPVYNGTATDTTLNLDDNKIFYIDLNGFTGAEINFSGGNDGDYITVHWVNNIDTLMFSDSLFCTVPNRRGFVQDVVDVNGYFQFYKNGDDYDIVNSSFTCDPAYIAQYQLVLDSAVAKGFTLPADTVQDAQNEFVTSLVNSGIWDKMDVLYVFASNGDSNFQKLDFIRLDTAITGGTVHFQGLEGVTSDSVSGYLDIDYLLASASNGEEVFRALSIDHPDGIWDWGDDATTAGAIDIFAANNAGNTFVRTNAPGDATPSNSGNTSGMWVVQREDATNVDLYFDGIFLTAADHTGGTPNASAKLILMNHGGQVGNYSKGTFKMFALGNKLTVSQIGELHECFQNYLNAIQ